MIFDQQLKKVLIHYNLSQVQLADKLGIQTSKMSRLITGESEPDLKLLQKLKQKLDVNLNWLISGEGKMREDINAHELGVSEPTVNYGNDRSMMQMVIDAQAKTIKAYEKQIEELESKKVN